MIRQPILDCFIPKFKLKYDDLENIKTDRVNTVVFNLLQIKQLKFLLGHPVVRVSHIIAEVSKDGEVDQVLDTVKGAVQGMHQVVQGPRKMREGKGLAMFLSGKAIHQIDLGTYQDV